MSKSAKSAADSCAAKIIPRKRSHREGRASPQSPKKTTLHFRSGGSHRRRKKRTLITIDQYLTSSDDEENGLNILPESKVNRKELVTLVSAAPETKRKSPPNAIDLIDDDDDSSVFLLNPRPQDLPIKKMPPKAAHSKTAKANVSSTRSPSKQTKLGDFPSKPKPQKTQDWSIPGVIDLTEDVSLDRSTAAVERLPTEDTTAQDSVARMPPASMKSFDDDRSSEDEAMTHKGPLKSNPNERLVVDAPIELSSSASSGATTPFLSPMQPKKLFHELSDIVRSPEAAASGTSQTNSEPNITQASALDPDAAPILLGAPGIQSQQWDDLRVPDNLSATDILKRFGYKDTNRPLTFNEFREVFRECDRFLEYAAEGEVVEGDGDYLDYYEKRSRCLLNNANRRMVKTDTTKQRSAMYGRILFDTMHVILEKVMQLKAHHVFLDIGHGIGNTCFQAAYTIGCEARGIEIDGERHMLAKQIEQELRLQHQNVEISKKKRFKIGKVDLRKGDLADSTFREFIIRTDVAFCNNFNEVFSEKSAKTVHHNEIHLDKQLAGLFCRMRPGGVFVTLWRLPLAVPSYDAAKRCRERIGLEVNQDLSFYDLDIFELQGKKRLVSWNVIAKPVIIYRYTRRAQRQRDATFLCCNPHCELARGNVPAKACFENDEGHILPVASCRCMVSAKVSSRWEKVIKIDV